MMCAIFLMGLFVVLASTSSLHILSNSTSHLNSTSLHSNSTLHKTLSHALRTSTSETYLSTSTLSKDFIPTTTAQETSSFGILIFSSTLTASTSPNSVDSAHKTHASNFTQNLLNGTALHVLTKHPGGIGSPNTTSSPDPGSTRLPIIKTSDQSLPYRNSSNNSIPTATRAAARLRPVGVLAAAAVASPSASQTPKAKKVFAHYMLGTVTQEHARQDIDEAIAMGIDGFAFNIGDPSQPFVVLSLRHLIGYAQYRGFYFYFSLDVYASGNSCFQGSAGACGGPAAYHSLIANNKGNSAWYKGPNGKPLISTFSSGGLTNVDWAAWKKSFAQDMYFIPNFDETKGYYEGSDAWYYYWGDIVDGVSSWESSWPRRENFGGNFPGDISPDLPALAGATAHQKGYMIGLSALQYKNSYGTNIYRGGDLNLPIRMENILAMKESPDFVQLITWNDGPESHYIGNIWYEQNNDTLPYRYANDIEWDHHGWQSLIASFIAAWKANKPAKEMVPPNGAPAVGALWYKTILSSSTCPISDNLLYYEYSLPADGFNTGKDQLNYAVVIEAGATGYSLNAYSGGIELGSVILVPGLNYGAFPGSRAGNQQLFLWHNGAVVLSATTGRCISGGCPDCHYNMNPQVVELTKDTGAVGPCPYSVCKKQVFAHYMVGNVDEGHAHTDIDNAVAMGLDGFALNVGDPTQSFVTSTFKYMFDYAASRYPNFHLFLSMDLWANGNAFNGVQINTYKKILRDYKGHPAYLQGPDGKSFVSSFSSGGLNDVDWSDWRKSWADQVYLVPDIDDTAGYNTSDPGWWGYWGGIIQGAFSWETAWPKTGQTETQKNEVDKIVIDGTFKHVKSYMMPLSPLQYKNSYATNYFRGGNLNLPERISAILKLNPSPDFVEYITWNDGPESHYLGDIWPEQNNETQPGLYANKQTSHIAWQPLITSFISAFKSSLGPEKMKPPSGKVAIGAIWYNSIMTTSVCPSDLFGSYSEKPTGFETATDWINFAVVMAHGTSGAYLRCISDNKQLSQRISVNPGLNYGHFSGISAGHQRVELVTSDESVLLVAAGGRCISTGCPDCIYNLNPIVVGFDIWNPKIGDCSGACDSGSGSGIVYIDHIIYVDVSPSVACYPPCTLVFAPSTASSLSTISFSKVKTSFVLGGSTITEVTPLAIVTSVFNFWNKPIASSEGPFNFAIESRINPDPIIVTAGGRTLDPAKIEPLISDVNTLPTTVIISNGVTQTFEEDQITSLATLTSSTIGHTTLTKTSGTSSFTTVVPIWIQQGGFFWKPKPLPQPPYWPILTLPSFPPIPSNPCFKLFGSFKINCPPDKGSKTTRFAPGPPKPTCTANCGTVDNDCTTSTVTDYWVSCSDKKCSTTRSRELSGCRVRGTTTTTTVGTKTVLYGYNMGEAFPTAFAAAADLLPLMSAQQLLWDSMSPPTITSTEMVTVTRGPITNTNTIVVIETPPPVLITADCEFWDEVAYYRFRIYNIQGWADDGGKALHNEENGCPAGDVSGWGWVPATETESAQVYFNIDFFFKAGCIERAIISAGGPKIACQDRGIGIRKKYLFPGAQETGTPSLSHISDEDREAARILYVNGTASHNAYTRMNWASWTTLRTSSTTVR